MVKTARNNPNTVKTKRKSVCRICENKNSVFRQYGLFLCRQCFRELAAKIGFIKYS